MIPIRLPNGYGSVTKLSGKRRRPWMVRKTLGYDEETGSQIMQVIGYYATRSEAISALTLYNQNPYDIDARRITFAEVYEKWSDRKFEEASHQMVLLYRRAFKACAPLHSVAFSELRLLHLQEILDAAPNPSARTNCKLLFGQMYDFALKYDIVEKNYADLLEGTAAEVKTPHKVFSPDEIQILWDSLGTVPAVSSVLVMIYTGLRIGELTDIKSADVHLGERYMTGGKKTKAGRNRIIPINKKIAPIIQSYLADGNEYLFPSPRGQHMAYSSYIVQIWDRAMSLPGLAAGHRPHDCRHTFASLMDSAGANKLSIKRIIGHASNDITDSVYTHKSVTELINAVDLI